MQIMIRKMFLFSMCLWLTLAVSGCESKDKNEYGIESENDIAADIESKNSIESDREKMNITESDLIIDYSSEENNNIVTEPENMQVSADDNISSQKSKKGNDTVDLDLTEMSSTMIYAEVYDMMVSPESYMGKTVKMDGIFATYYDETTDITYFACIIQDATACCSQGMEFSLEGDYVYPDDYPVEGDEICVIGTFDTYEEGDEEYCILKDARLVDI